MTAVAGRGLDVCLVTMPFRSVDTPALGPAVLQAELVRAGHRCTVRHLDVEFAAEVGLDTYQRIERSPALFGEWLFTASLHGPDPERDAGYLTHFVDEEDHGAARELAVAAANWLERVAAEPGWARHDLVGFSSVFAQNVASLALARLIRGQLADRWLVFGGANWEGDMGVALLERYPFVDGAISGEADRALPALADALATGRGLDNVPGLVRRVAGQVIANQPEPIEDLDSLAIASFDDYFAALRYSGLEAEFEARSDTVHLSVETARGCWWGQRSHCVFCGLNANGMAFRAKSPDRVLAELRTARDGTGVRSIHITDNILDMRYFRTVLPRIATELGDLSLFWEVKANLTHHQLQLLAAAGVREIQPGIESLSDHVLDLIGKGATAATNLQLLKWSAELGIDVAWNILVGFPGETPQDSLEPAALAAALVHLQPPSVVPAMTVRFSPFHKRGSELGLRNIRAHEPYRFVYPFDDATLDRIAYVFDHDLADGAPAKDAAVAVLVDAVQGWRRTHRPGSLTVGPPSEAGDLLIEDRRPGWGPRSLRLTGWKAAVYEACDRARPASELAAIAPGPDELALFLAWLARAGLLVSVSDRHLALAVHDPPRREPAPKARRVVVPLAVAAG